MIPLNDKPVLCERNGIVFQLHWKHRYGPIGFGIALMAGGMAYQGYAAKQEADAAKRMADYNAKLQEREAKAIEARGRAEQIAEAERANRGMSTMLALQGKSGAATGAGSPLLVRAKQAAEYELENLRIGANYSAQASRARSQGALDTMSGQIAQQRGKNEMIGSFLQAGSTVLSGYPQKKTSSDMDLFAKHMGYK